MKHILKCMKVFNGVLLAGGLLFTACTDHYESWNINPNEVTPEQMERDNLLTGAYFTQMERGIFVVGKDKGGLFEETQMLTGDIFASYCAPIKTWNYAGEQDNDCYKLYPQWYNSPFSTAYTEVMQPWRKGVDCTSGTSPARAMATIVKVFGMSRITDKYGPIPYSKVGAANAIKSPYDSQQAVYAKMLEDLDNIITVLGKFGNQSFSSSADRIYNGNTSAWYKFANSLKLRMAMRTCYVAGFNVNGKTSQQLAEEAVAAGVMTAATDGAYRKVADHNPWQRFMVLWSDARISADLTCYMNAYNDPRREAYYDKSTFGTVSGNAYTGEESYVGLRRGILQGQYNSWSQGSSCMKVTTSDNIVVFRASEVAFLRAEGALRNWNMGGTAKDFYEEGIRLSFEENGITSGVENYLASTGKVEAYKDPLKGQSAQTYDYSGAINTNVTVAWSGGDFEKSLEQIITQKWIANFPNGMESWTEYRRTGYPKLMPMAANASGGIVNDAEGARRMPYPTDEYRENRESVEAAVATLTQESKTKRGDTMATHVWWDCK